MLRRKTKWMCLTMLVVILLLAVTGCRAEPNRATPGTTDKELRRRRKYRSRRPRLQLMKTGLRVHLALGQQRRGRGSAENGTEDAVTELLNSMTVKEKIGQLVLVGIEGTTMDDTSRRLLEDYHVGGIILLRIISRTPSSRQTC